MSKAKGSIKCVNEMNCDEDDIEYIDEILNNCLDNGKLTCADIKNQLKKKKKYVVVISQKVGAGGEWECSNLYGSKWRYKNGNEKIEFSILFS